MEHGKIYNLQPEEPQTGSLPLFNAKKWAIGFLIFGILLAILFGATMPEFFKAAYEK
ncbi:hypothetical protein [Brevibacillus massiliensis]|jgi:uncharacterized protein involved in exopolysaccharide biosynthesis|uniref:hypothetical protein n=1 Tax=Brevibacillus massiliensis TaxID=1118054 RepID=UPI0003031451|nr:hypothetical protein [Brevibacillus massiliensis]